MKPTRLRVLEKRRRDARGERILLHDNRLGVIGNQHQENATEKLPSRFTRLDRARGGFLEGGIDKPVARANRGKDPGPKTPTLL